MQFKVGEPSVVDDASCQEFYTSCVDKHWSAPTNFDNRDPVLSTDGYLARVYTFNDTGTKHQETFETHFYPVLGKIIYFYKFLTFRRFLLMSRTMNNQ